MARTLARPGSALPSRPPPEAPPALWDSLAADACELVANVASAHKGVGEGGGNASGKKTADAKKNIEPQELSVWEQRLVTACKQGKRLQIGDTRFSSGKGVVVCLTEETRAWVLAREYRPVGAYDVMKAEDMPLANKVVFYYPERPGYPDPGMVPGLLGQQNDEFAGSSWIVRQTRVKTGGYRMILGVDERCGALGRVVGALGSVPVRLRSFGGPPLLRRGAAPEVV